MLRLKNILPFFAALMTLATPALAAGDDGGFGEVFTSSAPAALADDAVADYSGESLSVIEPAAGEQIWISPEEGAATSETETQNLLSGPDHALIPGMETPTGGKK